METVPPVTKYETDAEIKAKTYIGESPVEIESISPEHCDHEAERKVLRKTDRILLPMLCLMLIVAFLDRTNIGNAKIQGMATDLNLTGSKYNSALFMFFIPYLILDIPWNMIMKHLRPSRYLSALIFSWGVFNLTLRTVYNADQGQGIVTIGEGVTQSYAGLVVCRVLLGALEAGYVSHHTTTLASPPLSIIVRGSELERICAKSEYLW